MTGRTHDLAAVTALSLVILAQPPRTVTLSTAIMVFLANQFGGIAPDIDQPAAPFWRNLPIGGYIGRIIARMLGGHRFITHSLLGMAVMGFGVRYVLVLVHPIMPRVDMGLVWWAFMIGMFSHLVMDSITREGVPWLLPIPIKFGFPPVKQLRIVTGKKVENFVVFPLLTVALVALYFANSAAILQILHKYIV